MSAHGDDCGCACNCSEGPCDGIGLMRSGLCIGCFAKGHTSKVTE